MKADVLGGKQRRSFKKATISIILKNTEEQNTFFIPRGMFLQFIFMFTKVIISTLLEPLSERGNAGCDNRNMPCYAEPQQKKSTEVFTRTTIVHSTTSRSMRGELEMLHSRRRPM